MNNTEKLFAKLLEQLKNAAKFYYAFNLLEWDMLTKMPKGGAKGRAEIYAAVNTEGFKLFTSDKMGEILKKLEGNVENLNPERQLLVKRIRAVHQRLKVIPPDLMKAFNEAKSKACTIWAEAKEKSDFTIFQSSLEDLVGFMHQFAELYGYEKNPYDGLLPTYEPGVTTEDLKKIINPLRKGLIPFVHLLMEQPNKPDEKIFKGHFSKRLQKKLSLEALKVIGYDFNKGRLDTAPHPFTETVGPEDVRVTTRFVLKDLAPALFAPIHEGGHALYSLGKDSLLKWVKLDTDYSLGLHESQSLMWENIVGRSLSFWKFFYPKLQNIFPRFRNIALKDFYRAINTVKPSLIRIDADEVTYNLHVILRFEIEEALIKGEIKVKDLPELWNKKMKEYLGVVPKNDAEGVLQDIHWSLGCFGYFPTYMLGNLYAAQLFATAKREIPELEEEIAKGNLSVFLEWLRMKVHRFGLIYEGPELIREVTGESPTLKFWLDYIKEKYSKIYDIS